MERNPLQNKKSWYQRGIPIWIIGAIVILFGLSGFLIPKSDGSNGEGNFVIGVIIGTGIWIIALNLLWHGLKRLYARRGDQKRSHVWISFLVVAGIVFGVISLIIEWSSWFPAR